ncbi:hypothetical protein [Sphingomonas abietis]|uniref:Uncharacterized protein n=1 Tax=Sphingomonas abietis TaxID=3012344 RepID=A0ABY7NRM6_9SPHN|nr:hypothetical protein [Sphingomonas abietis]WBO24048.1 hypothetical protein PBT88_08045 [Sphingomonas abietis]
MKTLHIAMACSLIASFGLATAGHARPPHHRICKVTWAHHHKVRRCR